MHFDGLQWAAYSFRWNDAQTDAELVGAKGEDAVIAGKPWRFHSRSECLRCHNMRSNYTPGYSALTLGAQLESLTSVGLAPEGTRPPPPAKAPALEQRTRHYLHANCATCHQLHGGGSVRMIVEADRPLRETRLLDPPIVIPQNATNVGVDPFGAVSVQTPGQAQLQQVGTIQLAFFLNPEGLLQLGENLYAQTDASSTPTSGNPGVDGLGKLRQNMLEASNVEPVQELIDLITTQRSFELNSQAVQAGDQILQIISNLRRF